MPPSPLERPYPLLSAQNIAALPETPFVHPLNPKAVRHTRSLGEAVGFDHLGVSLVRVAPGDESTQFHTHLVEEEFIYILAGRGLADIGHDTFEVGTGDFMGFVAGSLPHAMRNPFSEDLVYLVGGLRLEYDVCDYPRLNKRLYRTGDRRIYAELGEQ